MESEAPPVAVRSAQGRLDHGSGAPTLPGIPRRTGCRWAPGPPPAGGDGDDVARLAQDSACDLVDGAERPGPRRLPGPRRPGRVRRRPLLGARTHDARRL